MGNHMSVRQRNSVRRSRFTKRGRADEAQRTRREAIQARFPDVVPDEAAAKRTERLLDRIIWLRITDDGKGCAVAATSRHRPVTIHVALPTALGLLERGVPTVLRSGGAGR